MDFTLTEEHRMVREMTRRFVENEVKPFIREWDRHGADPKIYARMAELGLLGLCIPRKWGGAGLDYISLGIACEELEYGDTFLRVIMSVHVGLTALTLLAWGTEAQKERFLVPQATGQRLGAFCLTEPNAGSDVAGMQSTARREGDHYLLNGEKIWISLAEMAHQYLVVAWTDMEKKARRDHSGMSAFIVEREREGVKPYTLHGKLGVRAGNTGGVVFENVAVPVQNRLGEEGEGFKIAMALLDGGRIGIGAQGLGIAQAALDAALEYSKQRVQFGRTISSFQGIQFMLADMAVQVDAARLLVYRAARMRDMGLPYAKEASMAKMYATDTAMKVSTDAVQIFGGYGYSKEYPVERYMRDAKITQIYEGTNQIQRMVIAKNLLK
mgnify:CR=1 FL=1